ncbi:MAG: CRISPR-associated helicase Cas3' [bacterium]|nr:CRISPR-associated helicase Cas3' [bacterium]
MDTYMLLWGKTDKNNQDRYHPLLFHMLDVANVTSVLWDTCLSASIRNRFSGTLNLDDASCRRFISFLAGLHDIGKASSAFQEGYRPIKQGLLRRGFSFPDVKCPHGRATTLIIQEWLSEEVGFSQDAADAIAIALGGHHGLFPGIADLNWCRLSSLGRISGNHKWDEVRHVLLASYMKLTLGQLPTTIPHEALTPSFLALLAAFTSIADWIASAHFPCTAIVTGETVRPDVSPADYLRIVREDADKAVAALQWILPRASGESISFSELFGVDWSPRPLQQVTEGIANRLEVPGLVIIEAPMGEGKTEAAIHLAEAWMRKLKQQGCYFALPTMATANSIFTRFHKDYLSKTHPEVASVLRLMHGQASVSEEYRQFCIEGVYDSDERKPLRSVEAEDWFAYKKRGLLSPYGVGTVDQALLAVLQTKHCFVRLFGLAGKTIIIDEVHAFDFYTRALLVRLLEWFHSVGSSVVLLSATLPKATRMSLLNSWGESVPEEKEQPYPRVTTVLGDTRRSVHVPESEKARRVNLEWVDESDEELSAKLCSAVAAGGCAVYVCNTVGQAQGFYQTLNEHAKQRGIQTYLLHARYPFREREMREADAVARFGKHAGEENNPPRPERAIMVSTQIIEQSLDVDFDLMVTDLAPVDLLLQRSGRLMRHLGRGIPRYSFDERKPLLWVRRPKMDSDGLPDFEAGRTIYSDWILLRTLLVLGVRDRVVRVPEDIEELIETVYEASSDLNVPKVFEERLEAAQADFQKKLDKLCFEAKKRLIKQPGYEGELARIFGEALEEDNPGVHIAFQANTRWSELPSVTVICLHSCGEKVFGDADCNYQVDLLVEPDDTTLRELMRATMSLSGYSITNYFMENTKTPLGWRNIGMLRHVKLAEFIDGTLEGTDFTLRLDPELGGVIEYHRRAEEDEY